MRRQVNSFENFVTGVMREGKGGSVARGLGPECEFKDIMIGLE